MSDEPSTLAAGQQAAAHLAEHPWIDAVTWDGSSLRVRPAVTALAVRPEPGELLTEYLDHWSEVYDWTYRSAPAQNITAQRSPEGDFSGWRASDTGEPLPVEHMVEWVDRTVELVLSTRPQWVLELGCGTGLLAHQLRPSVRGYVGTDVADSAVTGLAERAGPGTAFVRAAAHQALGPVVRAALRQAGFPPAGPDCVLLNSVTQCFPNVEYLTAVLHDAVGLVAPGAVVVVGDIRHAGLLDAYCRWLEASADPTASGPELRARAQARAARDDELTVDPAVLAAAASTSGRDVRISVFPKTMRVDTELTRYRFDAVLWVDHDHAVTTPSEPSVHSWSGPDALLSEVAAGRPVRVEGIPNRLLRADPDAVTAYELRTALSGTPAVVVLDGADPTLLAVVAPPSAAAVPAAELCRSDARAHEPFTEFVRRRLTEAVRTALRRTVPAAAALPVTVAVTLPGTVEQAETPEVLARVSAEADRAIDGVAARRMPEFLRELDQVALLAMTVTLRRTGLFTDGTAPGEAEIADALGVVPRHRWILRRWLAVLVTEGMLASAGSGYRDLRPVGRTELDTAARDLDRARRGLGYPAALTRFFQRAIEYLPELLRDEIALQALLFADGETGTADGAYRDNVVNRYVNAAAAEVLRWAAQQHGAAQRHGTTQPFRVLEVGAGVGATTADVLDALAARPLDYLFTDVSRFFLIDAKERFAGTAGLRFGVFDINADCTTQGVEPGSREAVLGANVLHNAHDIRAVLRGLRELLVPAGLLVFVETSREIYQLLTSMQFLMSPRPGQDRAGARDRRAGTDRIFLSEREWLAELRACGLRPMLCLPAEGHPLHPIGVQIFAAVRTED